jgi:hypothetical protein
VVHQSTFDIAQGQSESLLYPGEPETLVIKRPKSSLRHPDSYMTWIEYMQLQQSQKDHFSKSTRGAAVARGDQQCFVQSCLLKALFMKESNEAVPCDMLEGDLCSMKFGNNAWA